MQGNDLDRMCCVLLCEEVIVCDVFRRAFVDGYFNDLGGWVDNGRAIALLLKDAIRRGVIVHYDSGMKKLLTSSRNRVVGILTKYNKQYFAETVVLATGTV